MPRSFGFEPGHVLAGKYEVLGLLGRGWEGEVYRIRERRTRIERAAKLFFPSRNVRNRTATTYARKLHRLRSCPILVPYHTSETVVHGDERVTALISDYVEGALLSTFIARARGKRLTPFQGVHLLHGLAEGIECVHRLGEYHGDLHSENVIVQRLGLKFDLKLFDFLHRGPPRRDHRQWDVICMVRIFYDATGGQNWYKKHPPWVREICCGLKHSLIAAKFRTARELRIYLESQDWS